MSLKGALMRSLPIRAYNRAAMEVAAGVHQLRMLGAEASDGAARKHAKQLLAAA